jgi:uncharacterized protein (DUF1786 family)
MIVHQKVRRATEAKRPILLNGVMMGGGPSAWAVETHAHTVLKIFATAAAKTLNDELECPLVITDTAPAAVLCC